MLSFDIHYFLIIIRYHRGRISFEY
jgi:hypothetical protein